MYVGRTFRSGRQQDVTGRQPVKTRAAPRSESQETWFRGFVLSSARETPKGARVSHSRTSLFVFLSSLACASLGSAGSTVHGTIVDPSGRPVPRAHVRVLDPSGRERASAFADE